MTDNASDLHMLNVVVGDMSASLDFYRGRQPPFDAFWGARYAIVADPDFNGVGLMSPIDESHRTWPPEESPDPRDR